MRAVTEEQFVDAYGALLMDADQSPDKKLVIYVSAREVDSICALKVLQHMLKRGAVAYSVFPVTGWEDLQQRIKAELADDDDETSRSLVLINCGGTENLLEVFDSKKNTYFWVIDSHRPLHHANLVDTNLQVRVFCPDDGKGPSSDELNSLIEGELADAEDSEDDEEEEEVAGARDDWGDEEEEGEGGAAGGKRRRSSREGSAEAGERGGEGAGPSGEGEGAETRPPRRPSKRQRREAVLYRRQRTVEEYYGRGSFYGHPSAYLLFKLSHRLQLAGNDDLWLAIVSVTDHHVHSLLTEEEYGHLYFDLEQIVSCSPLNDALAWGPGGDDGAGGPEVLGRIVAEDDYRLPLLRHWSLLDSLLHSPYVAARMQTWRERGRAALEMLLARMWVPLRAAASCFRETAMAEYRPKLPDKVREFGPMFNLPDLRFPSFTLKHGYRKEMSATDMVYAAAALIECGHLPSTTGASFGPAPGRGGLDPATPRVPPPAPETRDAAAQGDDAESAGSAQTRAAFETSYEGFWRAWKALDFKNESDLYEGLEAAKRLQRGMLRQVGRSLAARSLIKTRHFNILDLSDGEVADRELFQQPLALARLANFLQDCFLLQKGRRKPHVVVGPAYVDRGDGGDGRGGGMEGFCPVVAVVGRPQVGEAIESRNHFAVTFAQTAAETKAEHRFVAFESSIIALRQVDVRPFLDELRAQVAERFDMGEELEEAGAGRGVDVPDAPVPEDVPA